MPNKAWPSSSVMYCQLWAAHTLTRGCRDIATCTRCAMRNTWVSNLCDQYSRLISEFHRLWAKLGGVQLGRHSSFRVVSSIYSTNTCSNSTKVIGSILVRDGWQCSTTIMNGIPSQHIIHTRSEAFGIHALMVKAVESLALNSLDLFNATTWIPL